MRALLTILALALAGFLGAAPAWADDSATGLAESEVRVFLDDFFARELELQEVVGAGVVVVHEGRVVASGGYGLADREENRPVVAESTVFPAQSVSKLFAATAVMQLYERGLVNLDADVRQYLGDVPVDNDFDQPVTLGHLLTHTPGFDDSYLSFLPRTPNDKLSVEEFATRYRRRVIFRPGTVHAYTNYGSLLARHAVETVTGRSYEEYLIDEIVRPLGMNQSCALPPPTEWLDRFATGYIPGGDGLESTRDAFPDGLVRFRMPTGTVASTVVDMARFMIAHLEGGSLEGVRILEPETVRTMHARQFAQHPQLPGATYGFFEGAVGGERSIFHFGSGFGYGTLLYLLPEHRAGFYIAHSNSASRIAEAFAKAFVERFFARPAAVVSASGEAFDQDAEHFAGYYVQVRRPETTFEKLPLWLPQARFTTSGPATIANDQIEPREWVRTGRLTFERPVGDGMIAFELDAAGSPTLASLWDAKLPQLQVLERVPWYDSTPALLARLVGFALAFLVATIGYPATALIRRLRRRESKPTAASRAGVTLWSAAMLHLAFLVGVAWIFVSNQFFYSVSPAMIAIFCLPLAAIVMTVIGLGRTLREEREPRRWWARVAGGVVAAALLLFPLFLARWNLLGFHF